MRLTLSQILRVSGFLAALLSSSPLHAQWEAAEGGDPGTPPSGSTPAGTAEPSASPETATYAEPVAEPARAPEPGPRGPWVAGGLAAYGPGGAALRLEGGIPLGPEKKFALHLPAFFRSDRWSLPDPSTGQSLDYRYLFAAFVPGVQFEWRFLEKYGDLSLVAQGGAGVGIISFETPDLPFMPGGADTDVVGLVRAAASLRYVLPFGLLVEVQPAGMMLTAGAPGVDAAYEFGLTVGYRLH